MKNILSLLFLLLTLPADAQPHRGAIQVRLKDNKMLTVSLDGRHFKKYGKSITIADLPQGMHDLKVYYFYPANDPAYRTFRDNRSHAILAYKGRIQVAGGIMYYLVADPVYKTISKRESRTVFLDDNEDNYPISTETIFSDENDNSSYKNADNWEERRGNNKSKVLSYYRQENRLTPAQLNALKSVVEERIASGDKVEAIQQYLSDKYLMTDQLVIIMGWLSFESSKLQVAKYGYDRVLDKENYFDVSAALGFQSSKRELDEFIFLKNKQGGNNRSGLENSGRTDEDDFRNNRNHTGTLQQSQLSDLGRNVADRTGDSDKQTLMQQYLANMTLTTAQLATMLEWLSFEGSKLEFAKWAFNRTSDKKNFRQLKSKFTFSSSRKTIDDLALTAQ